MEPRKAPIEEHEEYDVHGEGPSKPSHRRALGEPFAPSDECCRRFHHVNTGADSPGSVRAAMLEIAPAPSACPTAQPLSESASPPAASAV